MGKQRYVKPSCTIISRVMVSKDANPVGVIASMEIGARMKTKAHKLHYEVMTNQKLRFCEKQKKFQCNLILHVLKACDV